MRRPIVIFLISFILGTLYFHYSSVPFFLTIPIVMVIIYVVKIKLIKEIKTPINYPFLIFIIFFFTTAGISLLIQDFRCGDDINLVGQEAVLKGTVFSYSSEEGKYGQNKISFILKDEKGKKYQVKWYTEEQIDENLTGRFAICNGVYEKPTGRRNPGSFDYSLYLKSKGIRYVITCNNVEVNMKKFASPYLKFVNSCVKFRDKFIYELEKNQPRPIAGVQKGIMFGIKDDMGDDVYQEFQKNGTAHLLATSGLHMGIIYGALSRLLKPGLRILPNIVIIFIMFCYVVMADFNPSIIRAFIMIVIAVIGRLLCRRYDLLASACVAGLIMLIYNPYLLFSAGFQMSFLAVFIMGFTLNKVKRLELENKLLKSILPVVIIQILMAPYILYNFNYFSFSSFIANPPVTALATWVLMLGSSFMIFPVLHTDIPKILTDILISVTNLMLSVNTMTYNNGEFTARLTSPSIFFILLFYGMVFFFLNEETIIMFIRNHYKRIGTGVLAIVMFCTLCSFQFRSGFENCNMMFIDIGQGNSMLFKSSDGKTLLIDGGGKKDYQVGIKTLMPALLKNGVKTIDYAYVTHWDTDHYKGIEEIAKVGMVKNIITYEGNIVQKEQLIKQMGVKSNQMHFLSRNDRFRVGKNITVQVLYPYGKSISQYKDELANEKENNRSLVSKVTVNDTDFLITGDIDENCEREMVSKIGSSLRADILQVPHHGSGSSSSDELLEAVKPKVAVFQCGKNNYGHPAPQIVEKYKKKGIIIYRNDLDGAIGLTIGKFNKVKIKTVISRGILEGKTG